MIIDIFFLSLHWTAFMRPGAWHWRLSLLRLNTFLCCHHEMAWLDDAPTWENLYWCHIISITKKWSFSQIFEAASHRLPGEAEAHCRTERTRAMWDSLWSWWTMSRTGVKPLSWLVLSRLLLLLLEPRLEYVTAVLIMRVSFLQHLHVRTEVVELL